MSVIGNRLLDLVNRGEFTDYRAAGGAIDDIMKDVDKAADSLQEKNQPVMAYRPESEEDMPEEYRAMISHYFKKISED